MSQEFEDYIKLIVDIEKKIISAGGRLHTDCEKTLLEQESKQENLWGGGVDTISKKIDCTALTNIRPQQNNNSMEILDPEIRNNFFEIVQKFFPRYEP
ncbi:hypothetical protein HZB97_02535 [Candidatus Gottesmanbacteria bacterium]|nr:hypothetical protein [Candidatus Gottesmanbacteria bacterium]MBI5465123.1 hypothetical protein [Candidatus Gottesmanbacteria bacterium]